VRREPVFTVLKKIEKSQWLSIEDLKRSQWEKLHMLITFAYHNTSFYKKRFDDLEIKPPDIHTFNDYQQIPLLSKRDVQENRELLCPSEKKINFTYSKTSGSTGTPISIRMSQLSWAYHHANIIRAMMWHGLDYFSREVRIGSQSAEFKKRLRSGLINNICNRIFIPAHNLNDEQIEKYMGRIIKFKPEFIYGYPTTLFRFAQFIEEKGFSYDQEKINIRYVVSHGEELEPFQREFIQRVFRCKIINGYGSGEVGIIAYECPEGYMHIPIESIYIETIPLEENNGGKYQEIVVTDLHNYAMPIIRYRIGDLGLIADFKCPCKRNLPVLTSLKGKIREFIETADGRKVHTVIFNDIFKDLISKGGVIYEWQVIEKSPLNFLINLVTRDGFNDLHLSYLKELFQNYLGKEIKLQFNFVNKIERFPSGKFMAFIREWK
jgi:phenylacetate-CoA ligase